MTNIYIQFNAMFLADLDVEQIPNPLQFKPRVAGIERAKLLTLDSTRSRARVSLVEGGRANHTTTVSAPEQILVPHHASHLQSYIYV